jgi:hypothetical protein
MQGSAYRSHKLRVTSKKGLPSNDKLVRIEPKTDGERIIVTSQNVRVTLNKLSGYACVVCFDKWAIKMPEGRAAVRFTKRDNGCYQLAYQGPTVEVKFNRRKR